MHDGGHVWQGGIHGRVDVCGGYAWWGACMVGGACMAGQHVWQILRVMVNERAVRILLE